MKNKTSKTTKSRPLTKHNVNGSALSKLSKKELVEIVNAYWQDRPDSPMEICIRRVVSQELKKALTITIKESDLIKISGTDLH